MPELSAISAFGAGTWSSEHGEFISDKHRRFAEVLHDYKPSMSLVFIPGKDRQEGEKFPFAIVEQLPGREPQVIRYLTEVAMNEPENILAWLYEGDLAHQRPVDVLDMIEAKERAQRVLQQKKWQEDAEDRQDAIAFYATGGRQKLHSIRHRKGQRVERGE